MKKVLSLILIMLSLFLFGCSKKEITKEEFKKIMEKEEFSVVEVTDQFKEYEYIKGAYVAVYKDATYQIEYYTFENNENADSFYKLNQEIFESQGSGGNISTSVKSKTYSKYSITTDEKYNYIARINNTVLYSTVDKKYKDKVNKLIKKLGY